jgi:hypothetical protein
MPRVYLGKSGQKLLGENGNACGGIALPMLPSTGAPSKAGSGAPTKGDRTGPGPPPYIGPARRNLVRCSHDGLTTPSKP